MIKREKFHEFFSTVFVFATGERSSIAYKELNDKIELFCELFCFVLLSTSQLMLFSILSFSIVNYYVFDLGAESFYLIFPVK